MSSYPPQRRYPDRGFDYQDEPPFRTPDRMESMSPLAQAALLMNPKALQIMSYVQNLGAQKEERERRRQLFDMALEDRRRAQAHDDFKTMITLSDIGALPVHPGAVGQFEAGLAGKGTISAPGGRQYSQLTPEQKATRTGKLKGIAETAENAAAEEEGRRSGRLVEVTLPPMPGDAAGQTPRKMWISRDKSIDYIKATRDIKAGKFAKSEFRTDPQTGKTYFFGIDADTGETVEKEMGTVMSRKPVPAGREPLPSNAEVEALMKQWRPNLYNSRGISDEDQRLAAGKAYRYDAATGKSTTEEVSVDPSDENRKAAQGKIAQAEKELRDAATDEIKARIRNQGSGRPGVTVTPPPTTKLNPSAEIQRVAKFGKPMPAANVAKAAAGLGISVEEFSRLWHSAGGTIAK